MSKYFAVLDVGSDEISAIAARWNAGGDYMLEGFCRAGSKGFRKGVVTDMGMATDSIRQALNKLKEKTGKKIHDVYAGVSSLSVSIVPSAGMLLISKYGREISETDINKCVEVGSSIKMPLDKESLHSIVRGFSVDGEKEIKNPLNLEAVKLGVNMNILTVNSSAVHNMSKCISQAGFMSAGFVFSGIASSYRVLSEDDLQMGVGLLDVGRELTEAMIFDKGVLSGCKVFPIGMSDLELEDGSLGSDPISSLLEQITLLPGWKRTRKVVVIGQGSLRHDVVESMENFLGQSVSAGSCSSRPFEDLPHERTGYISTLGILDYLQETKKKKRSEKNVAKRVFNKILSFIDKYF